MVISRLFGKLNHKNIKYCIKILVCMLLITSLSLSAYAKDPSTIPLKEKFTDLYGVVTSGIKEEYEMYYSEFLAENLENIRKTSTFSEIKLSPTSITASENNNIPLKSGLGGREEDALVWDDESSWYDWEFEVSNAGYYQVNVEYYLLPDSTSNAVRSLQIDGEHPYIETRNITFRRMWRDKGKPKVNNIGDEVRPSQVEIPGWRTVAIGDSEGLYSLPFIFYLSEGHHKVRLLYVDQSVAIGNIILKTPEIPEDYSKVLEEYKKNSYSYGTGKHKFQAESTVIEKNDPTIRLDDSSDPLCEPSSFGNIKLNVIGGSRWGKGEQTITWEFEVPEDGLYKIALRLIQDYNTGLPVYRQISIDGKVPFKELMEHEFVYRKNWFTEELSDPETGEPYLFYLKKGTHTLTMTVKIGKYSDIVMSLYEDSIFISDILQKITMITGSEPDPNYEYELDDNIPGLIDGFISLINSLEKKIDALRQISNKNSSIINNLITVKEHFERIVKNPDIISRELNEIITAQESLAIWYRELQELPLTIDYFVVASPDEKIENKQSNIFQKLKYTWKNFLLSFEKDYDNIGSVFEKDEVESDKILNVWISRGKEWGEILKEMADEDFTPNSGIYINMNVLPASQLEAGAVNALMLAISSGRAPDVALGVGVSSPVEFAIRDAVYDMSKFPDFPQVKERFLPKIFIPFEYSGGVYALPETMSFTVLIYRNDIIEELNIRLPDTWEDVYNYVLPILHQNNMEFYVPTIYDMFLYQYGGSFYNEDGTKSALDSPEAYMALKEFSNLYINYGVPVTANFYMRMRMGVMPMGIGTYSDYMLLSVAAPELAGRWSIAPVPGHRRQDGVIDRSVGGIAQSTAIILNQTTRANEAWEFLKWWTDAKTQQFYGREIEALIGVEARWNTANIDAFKSLAWKKKDLEVITYMFDWAQEMPIVLGGYFTSRHLNNAWNRIVIEGMNVRESLEMGVEDINRELRMKQEEYAVPYGKKQ